MLGEQVPVESIIFFFFWLSFKNNIRHLWFQLFFGGVQNWTKFPLVQSELTKKSTVLSKNMSCPS